MPSPAAAAARPSVSTPTSPTMSHSVSRPARRRPRSSSWSSCAIAFDGASTPVASAIPSGIASAAAPTPASAIAGADAGPASAPMPRANTHAASATNKSVAFANTTRPRCPAALPNATTTASPTASATRASPKAGEYAISADAAAAQLTAIVSQSQPAEPRAAEMPSPRRTPRRVPAPRPRLHAAACLPRQNTARDRLGLGGVLADDEQACGPVARPR